MPLQLGVVARLLNEGEEQSAQDALELFIEVAEAHPRFLRRHLTEVAAAMLQVRRQALVLVCLAQCLWGRLRVPNNVSGKYTLTLRMSTRIMLSRPCPASKVFLSLPARGRGFTMQGRQRTGGEPFSTPSCVVNITPDQERRKCRLRRCRCRGLGRGSWQRAVCA